MTGAGVLLGGVLPTSLHLELAAPLTFLLLLLPMLTHRAAYGAAVTGGIVAVAASGLPLGLGLLVGAGAGIAVGATSQVVMGELLTLVVIGVGHLRDARGVPGDRPPPTSRAGDAAPAAHRARGARRDHAARAHRPTRLGLVADTVPALLAAAIAAVAWRRTKSLPVALFGGMALWWLASWALAAVCERKVSMMLVKLRAWALASSTCSTRYSPGCHRRAGSPASTRRFPFLPPPCARARRRRRMRHIAVAAFACGGRIRHRPPGRSRGRPGLLAVEVVDAGRAGIGAQLVRPSWNGAGRVGHTTVTGGRARQNRRCAGW